MKYLLLLSAIFTLSLGQIFLKKGVTLSPPQLDLASIIKTISNPYVFLGYFFYGLSSILGLFVLKKFPFSVAMPSMSITYVIILFVSALLFQEKFTFLKLMGVALIIVGVSFLFKG